MQGEAEKAEEAISQMLQEKAALGAAFEAQTAMLNSAELQLNNPELQLEGAAIDNQHGFGIAQELFVRDRSLADFK